MPYRRLLRITVVLAVICVTALLQPLSASANVGPAWIFGLGSSKCVDVPNGNPANSVTIIIYDCHQPRSTNQEWYFEDVNGGYQIRNRMTNKCLAVYGAKTTVNAPIIQYTCNQTTNSLWRSVSASPATDWYYIKNQNSDMCLTVRNNGTTNNATLLQFTCNDGNNQIWTWF